MPTDFQEHNQEVRKVWDAFGAGKPTRVPVVFGISEQNFILDARLNRRRYTFREYMENPDVMMEVQLHFQEWSRWNVVHDREMGPPQQGWEPIHIDFQNTAEAAWLGCPICYGADGSVPDTEPILREDKAALSDMEIPDPIHGSIMGRALEFYEYMIDKLKNYQFRGRRVNGVIPVAHMTDGPFTLACKLRGATELCLDMYEDPDWINSLMEFVTEAIIRRGKAWYDFMDVKYPMQQWLSGFADDFCELLSVDSYRRFVLPFHRRLVETFSQGGPNHIHLCGRVQHLFKTLQEELNIQDFYVGFPSDIGKMRRELGPEVRITGNLHPLMFRNDGDAQITEKVREALASGVMEGGNFILSGDVAPGSPPRSLAAAYDAAREYGRYC